MKTLGITYYDKDGVLRKKPFKDKNIFIAYKKFSEIAMNADIKVVIAKPEWYANRKFVFCWSLITGRMERNVPVDFVFDRVISFSRSHHMAMQKFRMKMKRKVRILNEPFIEDVCNDKYKSYLLFRQYSPKTFLSSNGVERIGSDLIVVKPRFGASGKDVKIIKKKKLRLKDGYIIQEFIDTSKGIRGIIDKTHDLRLVVLNGKIILVYLRVPRKGLVSNVALGGKEIHVPLTKIPKRVLKIFREVDKKLSKFKLRFYTIDFLIDADQKPWIVELNSHPGLYILQRKYRKAYFEIYRHIISEIKKII